MSVLPVSSLAMAEPQSPHLELTRPLCACEHTWEMCSPPWSRRGWAGWRESVSTMSRVPFPRPCPCGCRAVAPASSTVWRSQIRYPGCRQELLPLRLGGHLGSRVPCLTVTGHILLIYGQAACSVRDNSSPGSSSSHPVSFDLGLGTK